MGKSKALPDLSHLVEDYGLETLLEMNDIEPQTVVEILINLGMIDLEDLYVELEDTDND